MDTDTEKTDAPEDVATEALPDDWSPARTDPETGIALDGHDLPVNHRLRAEALADMGKDEDPTGDISPELIANTKARLTAEREARPRVSANMKVADLERIAKREDIDISRAGSNAERVAMIEAARSGLAPPPPNDEENV